MSETPLNIQVYREHDVWKAVCKNCGNCFATGTNRALLEIAAGEHACDPGGKTSLSRANVSRK